VFCFPYQGLSGIPIQFLRLATTLSDRGWSVQLVDFPDGAMSRNLRDDRVTVIQYSDERPAPVPAEAVLVFQTMTPWSIFPGLNVAPSTRLLFWTCHPFNLVPTVPVLGRVIERGPAVGSFALRWVLPTYWGRAKRFLRTLTAQHSIVFMDVGTVRTTSAYLQEEIPAPIFVPLPAPSIPDRVIRPEPARDRLRLAWLGRIADFKYSILSHTLVRLDQIASQLTLTLSMDLVGSGAYVEALKADAARLKHLEVRFVGERSPDEVTEFLRSDVDVLFAMGNSALEGASHGIPTILLDFSYHPVPRNYRFTWLHHRTGYSLGEMIGPEHLGTGDDGLMEKLLEAIEEPRRHGEDARRYVQRHHAIESVADRLEIALQETGVTWEDLESKGMLERGTLYRCHTYLKSFRRAGTRVRGS
jgi:glycosyltransferase involved in cell wall biosynthesis